MVVTCWSVKGGSGTTVVAACLALTAAHGHDRATLLVDPLGDVPAVLGLDEPEGPGLPGWPLPTAVARPPSGARPSTNTEVRVDDNLSVLPRGSRPFTGIDSSVAQRLFACLAADGRFAVVDAGTIDPDGRGGGFPELVAGADRSLLVIRPCYLALRRASRSETPVDGVVLLAEPGRSLDARDVAAVVGAPVVAEIPIEPRTARLVDAGLLCSRMPRGVHHALGTVVGDAS